MTDYTPKVYRITRKMVEKVIPLINEYDVYVVDIKRHLDKDALKRVAGVTNVKSVSAVYVNEEPFVSRAHYILPYNDEYQSRYGNQAVYGNVIIVLADKAYNELADDLKTTDITTIAPLTA